MPQIFRRWALVFVNALALYSFTTQLAMSQDLTLAQYLSQVQAQHSGWIATEVSIQAKEKLVGESSLMFRPNFFFTGQYTEDSRPSAASIFSGTGNHSKSMQTGVTELLPTGTQMKLAYTFAHAELIGANPIYVSTPEYYDVGPSIELTQSLWRNFFGKEVKAQEQAQSSMVRAQSAQDRFTLKNLQMLAENTFWRLYYAQNSVSVLDDSLRWAKDLRDWNASRVRQSLADEIDLLQAESNLKMRELEMQTARIEVADALRSFNQLRQADGAVTLLGTSASSTQDLLKLKIPMKAPEREDLLAAKLSLQALIASAELGEEKNNPTFELFGSYGIYGRDKNFSDAQNEAFDGTQKLATIGVKFVAPFDFLTSNQAKQGHSLEKLVAEKQYQRKTFEVEQEWQELQQKLIDLQTRLDLNVKMEKVQKQKLEREKDRYTRGRTTTFQVLQFGQDHAAARLGRLRSELEILVTYNKLKLFEDSHHE